MPKTCSVLHIAVGEFEVFRGLDVAREVHHAVALNPGGRHLADRPLPNAEPELVELLTSSKPTDGC